MTVTALDREIFAQYCHQDVELYEKLRKQRLAQPLHWRSRTLTVGVVVTVPAGVDMSVKNFLVSAGLKDTRKAFVAAAHFGQPHNRATANLDEQAAVFPLMVTMSVARSITPKELANLLDLRVQHVDIEGNLAIRFLPDYPF